MLCKIKLLSFFILLLLYASCESDPVTSDAQIYDDSPISEQFEQTITADTAALPNEPQQADTPVLDQATTHSPSPTDPIINLPGLDASKNQRIVGPRGETILIPANSLVDSNGNTVRGNVQVEWLAALTPSEIYEMRAPTISNGTLLGSGGSVYLNATQNGNQLSIKSGEEIPFTVPSEPVTLWPKEPMRAFSGERRKGEVRWALNPDQRIETIPLSYAYYLMDQRDLIGQEQFERIDSLAKRYPVNPNNSVAAPKAEYAVGRDKARIAELVLPFYHDAKYAKSYVSTYPFLSRLRALTEHIFSLTRTVNGVHYIDERSGANQYIIDILKIYREHAHEEMRIADKKAAALLNNLQTINPNTPSTTAIHIRNLRKAYEEFVMHDLGLPIEINDRGINLGAADAFDQLVVTGLSLEQASKTLEQYSDRKKCIEGVRRKKIVEPKDDGIVTESWTTRLPDGREAVVRKRQTYTIGFSGRFGFLNIDRFIGPDYTKYTELVVTLNGPELSNERVSMFFPSINGYLELTRDVEKRIYRLPHNVNQLPLGQPMAMLVVGRNEQGYAYAMVKGSIRWKMNLQLTPENGELDVLTDMLERI